MFPMPKTVLDPTDHKPGRGALRLTQGALAPSGTSPRAHRGDFSDFNDLNDPLDSWKGREALGTRTPEFELDR